MATKDSLLNQWIKERRRALDLTQDELADCVGCSRVTIQKIELGQRRPSKQVAERLAQCLRLPAGEQEAFIKYARSDSEANGSSLAEEAQQQLQAVPAVPTNLPAPLTRLIGREQAVAGVGNYIMRDDIRLLTLTGAPGIGKTRLSMQVATELLPWFEDGVFFVELGPINDPSLLASIIGSAIGLKETGSRPIAGDLKEFLGNKRVLVVLDNFEQILDTAPVVIDLLSSCPRLKVLVTSREALHVPGEQQLPVPPLDLPDLARLPGVQALPGHAAISLFLERARAVDPDFRLTPENAQAVATICARLDGLPLAIELAAAHVKFLSPTEMLVRLDNRLMLLGGNAHYNHSRHLPPRQQTMRAAIEWSYRPMDEWQQQLLCRLGVFAGGWTVEAARAVCGQDAAEGIEALLEKSLLKRMEATFEEHKYEHRFTMLEAIREFALEGLEARGEAQEVQRLHALYFLELAERARPHLERIEQAWWFRLLEQEHSNLRAAISWSLERGEQEIALRFGGALMTFWYYSYPGEGRWWQEGALKGDIGEPSLTRARALQSAALALISTREYPQARTLLEESLQMYRALDDGEGIAYSLLWMGCLLFSMRSPDENALPDALFAESLERFQQMADTKGVASVLNGIGDKARGERDYPRAVDAYERSLALKQGTGNKQSLAASETNLAYALYHLGDYERAKALLAESVPLYQELAMVYCGAWGLMAWAGILRAEGDPVRAARLFGAANSLAATGGAPYGVVDQADREEIEAAIREDVGADGWRSAQEAGSLMNFDETIAFALEGKEI
jgi:predicted ATPase/transcriptional regulator with XRE-family HTH domain